MSKRSKTDWIAIHASATKPSMDIGAGEITEWHRARGWDTIGYHFVIRRDGTLEPGRDIDRVGAHVQGYNSSSIGICMVGGIDARSRSEDNYTDPQWKALETLVTDVLKRYPDAKVQGHRDFPNVHKDCPCFDAIAWARSKGFNTAGKPAKPAKQTASKVAPDIHTIMRPGDTGEGVRYLQVKLNARHYNAGPEDGIWGKKTTFAVMAFKRENGLGQIGEITLAQVNAGPYRVL